MPDRTGRTHQFISAAQIQNEWAVDEPTIDRLSRQYHWSWEKQSSKGRVTHYRQDHVETTMQRLGITRIAPEPVPGGRYGL